MKSIAAFFILSTVLFLSCKKDKKTQIVPCNTFPPTAGLHKCNGKFTHPVLGTFNYQNVTRNFQVSAPNTLRYLFSYRNASGNIDSTNLYVEATFSGVDSSVTLKSGSPAVTANFDVQSPNPNWYDSCAGVLYLKFSWGSGSRKVSDTCYFN